LDNTFETDSTRIKPVGIVYLKCQFNNQAATLDFLVVQDNSLTSILGLKGCTALHLIKRIEELKTQEQEKQDFIEKNKDVFEGLGKFPMKFHIATRKDATPVIQNCRRIPNAKMPKYKDLLDSLEERKIIAKLDGIDCETYIHNLTLVEKTNGSLRPCLDPKYLNEDLIWDPSMIPSWTDLADSVQHKNWYTVYDLKDGFYQVELDEVSQKKCAFNTPFGCYKFLRLPFGISSASEFFQAANKKNFEGIPNLFCYIDGLLLAADTEEEMDRLNEMVVQRAREKNVKFNPEKLQYKQHEVKYLGRDISKEGVNCDPERLRALLELPAPQNKKELQSRLGMFNFVRSHIPQLSKLNAPLRELLHNNVVFQWMPNHEEAWNKIKAVLAEDIKLTMLDPKRKIILQCDASEKGLGYCLLQEKPVAFGSQALTETQQDWWQIEKEMLAILVACKKLHNLIFSYPVLVQTDHQPLVSIFKKELCKITNVRLRRMRIELLRYSLEVTYIPGKQMYMADLLSRAFLKDKVEENEELKEMVHELARNLPMSKNRKKKFQEATEDDPELQLLKQLCKKEREIRSIPENLKHYWNLRAEIAYEEGLLFLGERLIVPKKLREQILKDLHEGHIGIERTIRKARQALYWPKMSRDIEQHISQCPICEKFFKRNYKAPLIPHEIPEIPFSKLGADILDFAGKPYLIVVDYLSTWIEIKKLRDKSARSVNDAIKDIATTHGYPDEIVTDNVPFNSAECRTFAQEHDFEFNTTSPRYPQANGMAEKAVGIAKLILRKAAEEGRDYRDLLLEHRASPMTKDNVSPAQILMSRRLKTKTPLTLKKRRPKVAENFIEAVKKQQEEAKKWYDRRARRREIAFKVGDKVLREHTTRTHGSRQK